MKILIIIVLLFGGHFAYSLPSIRAFSIIDKSYSKVTGELEIKNMPRVASQDGLGICYAFVAATQLQAEYCRVLRKDCSKLPDEELFSPLDIARIKDSGNIKPEEARLRSSYAGLNTESGGDPHNAAIIAGLVVQETANEACISLDKVLSKMNSRGETIEAQAAMWERMKKHYLNYQKNKKCADCLSDIYATAKSDIDENLSLTTSNEEILKAFGEDSYEKFLDQLLGANKCRRATQLAFMENADSLEYKFYPEDEKDPKKLKDAFSPDKFKGKIKEVLKTGRPLSLGALCVGAESAQNCKPQNSHAVVISGYRQICNQAGKCRESLRVVNSWGKSWQDQNDGGWVDADTLISSIKVSPQVLGYFADKK
ncbi:hypothetical protein QJS83_08305 [Bdellovibrio sp. 22V]|uniref:hypothetical protein n=1 Tax=Bdellovibrio sp. 22V TaxID=3044166 RepID=UPI0025433493|nr:hypothetical protein [Bdellovibrio sp. 22V]WII73878.1 hypothetical protein QJS83_08305 [Bdellovibrio sp. 22V]